MACFELLENPGVLRVFHYHHPQLLNTAMMNGIPTIKATPATAVSTSRVILCTSRTLRTLERSLLQQRRSALFLVLIFHRLVNDFRPRAAVRALFAKEQPSAFNERPTAQIHIDACTATSAFNVPVLAHRFTPFRISDVSMRHRLQTLIAGSLPSRHCLLIELMWLFFGSASSGKLNHQRQNLLISQRSSIVFLSVR